MMNQFAETPYGPIAVDFKWRRLAEICADDAGIQTGPFGSQLHQSDYVTEGTPIITVEHLGENRIIHRDMPRVTDEDRDRLERYTLRTGDIVFSRVGSVDRRALVREEENGWLFSGRCLRVRPKPDQADPCYLSLFFGLPTFKEHIRKIAVGATMPSLNTEILSNVPVYLPPLPEQRAIAHILGTLDDKIELNRKMNETLEAIARAIFKSWFLDFDPVRARAEGRDTGLQRDIADLFPSEFKESELGMVPWGWRVGSVSQLACVQKDSINPNLSPEEEFDHYSIPAFDEGRWPKKERGEEIKSNKFLVPARAVLLSKLNPRFPRVWLPDVSTERRSICSTEFLVMVPEKGSTREYLYGMFNSRSFVDVFSTLVTGTSSSHQRVKSDYLGSMKIILPEFAVVQAFSEKCVAMFEQISGNLKESRILASTRDTLLPKLLSGEVRVKETEKFTVGAHSDTHQRE